MTLPQFKPRPLLRLDAAGALVSALLLGIVLPAWQPYFGIPLGTLYLLAAIPVLFLLYDLAVLLLVRGDLGLFLRIIAVGNGLYCVLSVLLAGFHADELTWLGWAYLAGEVVIVSTLSRLEWISSRNESPL